MANHISGVSTEIGLLTEKFMSLDQWRSIEIEYMTLGQLRIAAGECYQIGKIIRAQASQLDTGLNVVHLYPDMHALGYQFNRKADQFDIDTVAKDIAKAHDINLMEGKRLAELRVRVSETALDRITGHSRGTHSRGVSS